MFENLGGAGVPTAIATKDDGLERNALVLEVAEVGCIFVNVLSSHAFQRRVASSSRMRRFDAKYGEIRMGSSR